MTDKKLLKADNDFLLKESSKSRKIIHEQQLKLMAVDIFANRLIKRMPKENQFFYRKELERIMSDKEEDPQ